MRKLPPLFFSGFPVPLAAFVGLGQDNDHGQTSGTQPGHQFEVQALGRQPAIDERRHGQQPVGLFQVGLDEPAPFVAFGPGTTGIAVSRQIHQAIAGRARLVEVEAAGLARSGADFGQGLAPGQAIDQGRFAHVGPPGQGDLGRFQGRDLVRQVGRDDKGQIEFRMCLGNGIHAAVVTGPWASVKAVAPTR